MGVRNQFVGVRTQFVGVINQFVGVIELSLWVWCCTISLRRVCNFPQFVSSLPVTEEETKEDDMPGNENICV